VPRTSSVLDRFSILVDNQRLFEGKAVVSDLVKLEPVLLCEAALDGRWLEPQFLAEVYPADKLKTSWARFLRHWERQCRMVPEFKLLVADIQSFLTECRLWIDQVEVGIGALASTLQAEAEERALAELAQLVFPMLDGLFGKFETVAFKVPSELRGFHAAYLRRLLHPLLLGAPFVHRSYAKPLGYAGDYEMVNMILRDTADGPSLFDKVVNAWFLRHPPAQAHRNRIDLIAERLIAECLRSRHAGRPFRVYNVGCGPAWEIGRFLEHPSADGTTFELVDFNQETLLQAEQRLRDAQARTGRRVDWEFRRKAVAQLLRPAKPCASSSGTYDFVYCAGLMDYLPDHVCRQLTSLLYDRTAPGGLLVTTNVNCTNPSRNTQEYVLEWFVNYRNAAEMRSLAPPQASGDHVRVSTDATGVNLFLDVRKPDA